MAVRVRNPQGSAVPLPFPFRGVLGPGQGVVLALTAAQVQEAIGAQASQLFELDEVPDLVGDTFALGSYGGPGNALNVKTLASPELPVTLGGAFAWDLSVAQFQTGTLSAPCTITILPNAPAPGGSGHFQLLLKGTAANAVTWTNIVLSGTPDLTTANVWSINVYPDRSGVFRATAIPFAS